MNNLARGYGVSTEERDRVTAECRAELEQAGIDVVETPAAGEVPSTIMGSLNGWTFRRFWYYWVARTDRNPLSMVAAVALHATHGKDVRVDGHCGCPAPDEWWTDGRVPDCYHVDSQVGLNALAAAIRLQDVSRANDIADIATDEQVTEFRLAMTNYHSGIPVNPIWKE